jgi:WD40 repeat protein
MNLRIVTGIAATLAAALCLSLPCSDLAAATEHVPTGGGKTPKRKVPFAYVLSISPDGKLIAYSDLEAANPYDVVICDGVSGRKLRVWQGHVAKVEAVAFSRSDGLLFSPGVDGKLLFWSLANWKLAHAWETRFAFSSLDVSPTNSVLALGAGGSGLLWDYSKKQDVGAMPGHTIAVRAIRFSRDGKKIVTSCFDSKIRIWDGRTGKYLTMIDTKSSELLVQLAISPSSNHVAVGDAKGRIMVWDYETLAHVATMQGHTSSIASLAFSSNAKRLLSSTYGFMQDAEVKLWNYEAKKRLGSTSVGADARCLHFLANERLVTGVLTSGGDVALLELKDLKP